MLKIVVKHQGKILHTVELEKDRTVHVGRSQDCFIVLPEGAGLSRKHLQLALAPENENKVMVKNLSSLSPLVINGEEVEEGLADTSFQVQNYEFVVQQPLKPPAKTEEAAGGAGPLAEGGANSSPDPEGGGGVVENQEAASSGAVAPLEDPPPPGGAGLSPPALRDKTAVMDMSGSDNQQVVVYLKVDTESGQKDIFKLKQNQSQWLVGRDSVCDLVIDDSNISRQHFKIKKEGNYYFVMDLKSSNGTFLNDREMKSKKNYRLESGDVLSVLDRDMLFEIKNLSIEQEMARLKPPPPPGGGALVPSPAGPGGGQALVHQQAGGGAVVPYAAGAPGSGGFAPPPLLPSQMPSATLEGNPTAPKKWYQNKKFVFYAAGAAVVGFLVLSGEDKKSSTPKAQAGPLAGLTAEQKKMIQDTYISARELYSQGRYEHCRSELKKIHEHTDSYKESKRLEVECAQAAINQQSQWDLEQKNKKARRLDALIQKVTNKCQKRFNTFKSKADLMSCLKQALELAPADSRVQVLFEQYESKMARLEAKRQRTLLRRKKVQALIRQYEKAKQIRTAGKTIPAIKAYKKFMQNSTKYTELASTRQLAGRQLQDMTARFEAKTQKLQTECDKLLQSKKFKEAYYSCRQASEVLPPGAKKKQALSVMKQAKTRLQNLMKPLYEDASIHESIGNIITAKQKWNKILDQDIKSGFYYEKAQVKMSKY